MKHLYKTMLISTLIIMGAGCKKFPLVKNADTQPVAAGENLKEKTVWQFVSENNFHANDYTGIGLFGKAVEKAGLKDLLNADGDYTVVIPSDKAIIAYVKSIGYATIDDVPAPILKNALLDNIFKKRIRSFDLPASQVITYETLNKDSIAFSREPSSADAYVVFINKSPSISSANTTIRTQNLELKNAVAHVVDVFTYYQPKITNPDAVDTTKVKFESDTVFVIKDSYVTGGGSRNRNFNTTTDLYTKKNSDAALTRRALAQYPIRKAKFSGRIGSAKVNVYVHRIDGSGSMILYQDEYKEWTESLLTYTNSPVFGTGAMGSIGLAQFSGLNKWYQSDITAFYNDNLTNNRSYINIGFDTNDNNLYGFRPREFSNGQFKSFILLTSPPVTLLSGLINKPLLVEPGVDAKSFTTAELKLQGTADKNIFYSLLSLPKNGFVVLNGTPLKTGAVFTQEQIVKGAVKYIAAGARVNDSFTLEAKDFQGGYYPSIITCEVQFQ